MLCDNMLLGFPNSTSVILESGPKLKGLAKCNGLLAHFRSLSVMVGLGPSNGVSTGTTRFCSATTLQLRYLRCVLSYLRVES